MTDATQHDDDMLWGAEAIGREIARNERQTFHLLQSGKLLAKKVGHIWVTTRRALRDALTPRS